MRRRRHLRFVSAAFQREQRGSAFCHLQSTANILKQAVGERGGDGGVGGGVIECRFKPKTHRLLNWSINCSFFFLFLHLWFSCVLSEVCHDVPDVSGWKHQSTIHYPETHQVWSPTVVASSTEFKICSIKNSLSKIDLSQYSDISQIEIILVTDLYSDLMSISFKTVYLNIWLQLCLMWSDS